MCICVLDISLLMHQYDIPPPPNTKPKFLSPRLTTLCTIVVLRVCLFGGKIGWMENFGKKMGRKTFLKYVWLDGEKGK